MMPWLSVDQTWLAKLNAVPTPHLALEVQRGVIPGRPGADCVSVSVLDSVSAIVVRAPSKADQGEPRLRIDLLAEVFRRLDEYHLERRPDVRLDQVAARRRAVRPADDNMGVDRRLVVLQRDVAEEREDLD